ncbi:MAG: CHAT domain-containing protein, partial [Gemmatimonadales bacterium]
MLLRYALFATVFASARLTEQQPEQDVKAERKLTALAREHPDSVRDAIAKSLSATASATLASERAKQLAQGRKLAAAYAHAWNDPFFVNQITRFQAASPQRQRERVRADSLRRSGNLAVESAGLPKAMALWRAALSEATSVGDSAAIAPALMSLGAGLYRLGNFDSATVCLRKAETIARQIGDQRTLGNSTGILASVAKDRGDLETAETLYHRATAIRTHSGDTRGIAADENNLGSLAQARGDIGLATVSYRRALAINRRDRRPTLVALNLSNLASAAASTGDNGGAEALYREALSIHQTSGATAESAFDFQGLGKSLIQRGDYRDAEKALTEALRLHKASGNTADAIDVSIDLAAVETAIGNPDAARSVLQAAERIAGASNQSAKAATLALAEGNVAMQFGGFDDADIQFSRSVRLFRSSSDSAGLADALEAKALLAHSRGDARSSLSLLGEAARLHSAAGNRRSASLSNLLMAEVEIAADQPLKAQQTILKAYESFKVLHDPVSQAASLAILGDISLGEGSIDTAARRYRSGVSRLGSRSASDVGWRLHSGLGEALRRQGSLTASASEFRAAINAVEKTAAAVRLEQRRSGFLADKWGVYASLASVELARHHTAEAFSVSEQMRARQMLDMLARGHVSGTLASREEQDLRRRISYLTESLQDGGMQRPAVREPSLNAPLANARRQELDRAQKAYEKHLLTLRDSDPSYARMISAKTRSWKEVASTLRRDQVFLEYLVTDSATTAFVVTTDTIVAIDLHIRHKSLADLAEFSRKTVEQPSSGRSRELWETPLRRLYGILIQPVSDAGFLRGKEELVIAPHAELHFISFAALIGRDNHFLVDAFRLAYTPSATVWVGLRARHFPQRRAGVLALVPNYGKLPGTLLEATAIKRIYGANALIRSGAAATPLALREALPRVGTVHLATFGVLNKHNPLFSFIELAPGRSDDGRLEVNEVFGLPLSGQLIILSACQTALASGALADVPAGDDWVGLVQAFLQSGARGVVASLWPVEDRATGELMEQFHVRL